MDQAQRRRAKGGEGSGDHSAGHGAEGARDPERAGRSEAVDERAAHGPGDVGELGAQKASRDMSQGLSVGGGR